MAHWLGRTKVKKTHISEDHKRELLRCLNQSHGDFVEAQRCGMTNTAIFSQGVVNGRIAAMSLIGLEVHLNDDGKWEYEDDRRL